MPRERPYEIKIEPDLSGERRFRWTIWEGELVRLEEAFSYATRREAIAAAEKVMLRLAKDPRTRK